MGAKISEYSYFQAYCKDCLRNFFCTTVICIIFCNQRHYYYQASVVSLTCTFCNTIQQHAVILSDSKQFYIMMSYLLYIDPGSSYLIQAIIAGALGFVFFFKNILTYIKSFFTRKSKTDKDN